MEAGLPASTFSMRRAPRPTPFAPRAGRPLSATPFPLTGILGGTFFWMAPVPANEDGLRRPEAEDGTDEAKVDGVAAGKEMDGAKDEADGADGCGR